MKLVQFDILVENIVTKTHELTYTSTLQKTRKNYQNCTKDCCSEESS